MGRQPQADLALVVRCFSKMADVSRGRWQCSDVTSICSDAEVISTVSDSFRWVTCLDLAGFRRSRSICKSDSDSIIPGGQPSMMPRYPEPWLSPDVVKVNNFPKVLPDIVVYCIRNEQCLH